MKSVFCNQEVNFEVLFTLILNVCNLNIYQTYFFRHQHNKHSCHPLSFQRNHTGREDAQLLIHNQGADGFGGLVVSMLASVTQVCVFKPDRSRWIFRA